MGKKIPSLSNLFIEWLILPIFLFFIWTVLSFAYLTEYINKEDYSFSVLSKNHEYIPLIQSSQSNTITGEFTAGENFLGVVLLRFDVSKTIKNVPLSFKIKEKGESKWYHESESNTKHIQYLPLLPFGLPVIEDSRGKTYVYTVFTQKETETLTLSNEIPNVVTKYQFPKAELLADSTFLLYFLQQKAIYIIQNSYFLLVSVMYLMPFVLYVIFILLMPENYLPKPIRKVAEKLTSAYRYKYKPLFFLMLSILSSIFFIPFKSDILYGLLILFSIYYIKRNKISLEFPFMLSLGFILLSFSLLILQLASVAEKAVVWGIIFLIIGTIMYSYSLIKESKTSRV